jgi:p-hydroxybenzoate 3-monooxygenase
MKVMRTQVGIVGAGPAGMMLAHLLHRAGIDSVVVESRTRQYVQKRVRAGVLEQGTRDLMIEAGVGARLQREGITHHGLELRFGGQPHRIDLSDLTGGKSITIYPQGELVKDLTDARIATGAPIYFDAKDVGTHGLDSDGPTILFLVDGQEHQTRCDFIAGCDGFHGITRSSIPASALTMFERTYPFAWLGILAKIPPSSEELIYCHHERGFALHSMRSPTLTRLYLQCDPDDDIESWPDDRIWSELNTRFATDAGWKLNSGPIVQKGITPMRSFVAEPMRYGRLLIAGDCAHIVPPTGAKGLNLAITDVRLMAGALAEFYQTGSHDLLDSYSQTSLRRVWKVQRFAWWMTSMLHRFPNENPFDRRRQIAELDYVTSSRAAAQSLAENYVGLPFD